ncbi:MAG TPA: transcriptional repressor LexA [Planctomycetota bacterium]
MSPRQPLTRRQRDILRFFADYTAAQGISPTLEEAARHFGVNKVTIFGHVSELERKGCLKRSAPGVSRGLQIVPEDRPAGGLPVLGTIAAGTPIGVLETPETLSLEELIPPGSDVYVLRVRGNSMIEDSIRDGDLVLVERRSDPAPGETVVAVLPGESATLKRFYPEPDGRIRLQPANADLEPILVDEVEIRGVVIGVIRRL